MTFSPSSSIALPRSQLLSPRKQQLPGAYGQASLAVTSPMHFLSSKRMKFPTTYIEKKQCSQRVRAGIISDSLSQDLTLGYAAFIGIGGVMGYMKGGSSISLIAGIVSAFLLYDVYTVLPSHPFLASSVGLGVSASLLAVMGFRYRESRKIFPAGVVFMLSLIMSASYIHGMLLSMHA